MELQHQLYTIYWRMRLYRIVQQNQASQLRLLFICPCLRSQVQCWVLQSKCSDEPHILHYLPSWFLLGSGSDDLYCMSGGYLFYHVRVNERLKLPAVFGWYILDSFRGQYRQCLCNLPGRHLLIRIGCKRSLELPAVLGW